MKNKKKIIINIEFCENLRNKFDENNFFDIFFVKENMIFFINFDRKSKFFYELKVVDYY